jgi:ketosteroid isomerase-like protein
MVTCAHDAPGRAGPRVHLAVSVSDAAAVEGANARFYRAFETLDLAAMERVWAHGEHVRCVPPGWPRLGGWAAGRESWQRIFAGTEAMRFTLSEADGRVAATAILATNLFERDDGGWRRVHHHASHVL